MVCTIFYPFLSVVVYPFASLALIHGVHPVISPVETVAVIPLLVGSAIRLSFSIVLACLIKKHRMSHPSLPQLHPV